MLINGEKSEWGSATNLVSHEISTGISSDISKITEDTKIGKVI